MSDLTSCIQKLVKESGLTCVTLEFANSVNIENVTSQDPGVGVAGDERTAANQLFKIDTQHQQIEDIDKKLFPEDHGD